MSTEKIQAELAKYEASVEKAVARFPERPHLPEQRLYTPLDIKGDDYADEISFPGVYPFTRGVQPTMYRGRFGPCVCMPASPRRKNPTSVIAC